MKMNRVHWPIQMLIGVSINWTGSGLAVYHCKNIISWGSKIQQIITLSPAEAKYVASATCVAEIIYLQGLPKH